MRVITATTLLVSSSEVVELKDFVNAINCTSSNALVRCYSENNTIRIVIEHDGDLLCVFNYTTSFKVYSASSSLSPDGSHKSSCAIIGVDTTLLLPISNCFNV